MEVNWERLAIRAWCLWPSDVSGVFKLTILFSLELTVLRSKPVFPNQWFVNQKSSVACLIYASLVILGSITLYNVHTYLH
jgi:hypothetical protein